MRPPVPVITAISNTTLIASGCGPRNFALSQAAAAPPTSHAIHRTRLNGKTDAFAKLKYALHTLLTSVQPQLDHLLSPCNDLFHNTQELTNSSNTKDQGYQDFPEFRRHT